MKKIIGIINTGLLLSLPILLLTVNIHTSTINSFLDTKKLATNLVTYPTKKEAVAIEEETVEDKKIEPEEKISTELPIEIVDAKGEESPKKIEETKGQPEVLATYSGTMSFYSANCKGCMGSTATGIDISDGNLYYNDNEYGQVRIVATGSEIKPWSIIKIKNSSLGSNVIAIALDKGSNIGVGKKFLIDMLTNSKENKSGIEKNITVEVLRSGK